MSSDLTIAYITCRLKPHSEWFFSSLSRQVKELGARLPRVLVVNSHHSPDRHPHGMGYLASVINVAPKPSPWAGPGRLTKKDWFRAASARNTALCLCPTSHIAYVDDLSVMLPGWLERALAAVNDNVITCGAYRKVKDLRVDRDGRVLGFSPHLNEHGVDIGQDSRLRHVQGPGPHPCNGDYLFGCSVVMPVEQLLSINGWPEDLCDGHGFEDSLTGIVLKNNDYSMRYDPNMMTYESEEGHHGEEEALGREDYGKSPNDKSHKALAIARVSKSFPNSICMRDTRYAVLSGGEFPAVDKYPKNEWFTKRHLSDL